MSGPRIIVLDLEILPDLPKALKHWPKLHSVFKNKTLSASVTSICCFGWKVLGEKKTHCINAWDFPEWKKDVNNDLPLLKEALKILATADQIVTHNGKRFDKKYLQTRLALYGLELLRHDPHSDTAQLSSSNFYFIDNKLQTLSESLGGEEKMDHGEGWDLWVKTHGKDPAAMKLMEKYCKQDVRATESIYLKLRPLDKSAVNQNLWITGKTIACPKCGSTRHSSDGYRTTSTRRYKRLICKDCFSRFRLDARDEAPRSI